MVQSRAQIHKPTYGVPHFALHSRCSIIHQQTSSSFSQKQLQRPFFLSFQWRLCCLKMIFLLWMGGLTGLTNPSSGYHDLPTARHQSQHIPQVKAWTLSTKQIIQEFQGLCAFRMRIFQSCCRTLHDSCQRGHTLLLPPNVSVHHLILHCSYT